MEVEGVEDFKAENIVKAESVVEEETKCEEIESPDEHVDTKEENIESAPVSEPNGHVKEDVEDVPTSTVKDSGKKTSWPAIWLEDRQVDERIINLIYWGEYQRTGAVFGGILVLLLSLAHYPFLCVITTFMKALLAVSFLYRIGMTIVNAVQKTTADHPLKHLLEEKIEITEEMMSEWPEKLRGRVNAVVRQAQHLFLINDFIDSLKFGVMLWLISYIASWFSLLTLVTMPIVGMFTLPKFYESYQVEVNKACDVGKAKVFKVFDMVDSKVPPKFKFYNHAKKVE